MEIKEEQICRLCLKIVDSDYEIIDEVTKATLNALLIKVDLDVSKDPVICNDCTKASIKCFHFKSTRVDRKKLASTTDVNGAVESKGEYKQENVEIGDDKSSCRFCSTRLTENNIVLSDILTNNSLAQLIPKTDSELICTSCRQSLEAYMKFTENCLDVEAKITKYCQSEATTSSGKIKLTELVRFLYNTVNLDHAQIETIKQEDIEVYKSEFIKVEEARVNSDTEPSIFQCTLCAFRTNHKLNLRRHALTHKHITEVKAYQCSTCTYQTKYKGNLKKHLLIHEDITAVETFKCPTCTFQAKRKSELKDHLLIHKDVSEVEMYRCTTCPYATKRRGGLNRHLLIHKSVTQVEMYKCSTCSYETKWKCKLKTHMLTHKDAAEVDMYKCSKCTFETKRKSNLKQHVLIHKNILEVESFKCSACEYVTKRKNNLSCHMLIHKGVSKVEMYKCSVCTFETKYKCNLKVHIKRH